MTTPISVHQNSRHQVGVPSEYIMSAHTAAPPMHVNQGEGVRKGRFRSGRVRRSTSTPMHTVTNAASVPMETTSARILTGNKPPISAAEMPVITVPVEGVRNLD